MTRGMTSHPTRRPINLGVAASSVSAERKRELSHHSAVIVGDRTVLIMGVRSEHDGNGATDSPWRCEASCSTIVSSVRWRMAVSAENSDIPNISEEEGRQHARAMYELLGHELCGITELRALGSSLPWVAYADNVISFVDLAMERNHHGDHVYVGLQPRPIDFDTGILNEWRPAHGGSNRNVAKASDIEFAANVALDIDVDTFERHAGQPASDAELHLCSEVAQRFLSAEGFAGTSAMALSGNGVYVINPIAPVEVDSSTAQALKVMERRWIAEAGPLPPGVRIDPIMDLPRIIRAIGTVNFKGRPERGRPHRRSRFLTLPAIGGRQNLVTEQLRYMSVSSRSTASEVNCASVEVMRGDIAQFEICEFVQWIGRGASHIPEPAWMDFLMQCAWLEGGGRARASSQWAR